MVMAPLATSLFYKEKKYVSYVWLHLLLLRNKLKNCTHLTYCNPLAAGIKFNLERRFKHVFQLDHPDRTFILSAISLPRFKLN